MGSWFDYVSGQLIDVVNFFRSLFLDVFPYSVVVFLFLFPAFAIVYGLVRYFHDLFR